MIDTLGNWTSRLLQCHKPMDELERKQPRAPRSLAADSMPLIVSSWEKVVIVIHGALNQHLIGVMGALLTVGRFS
jgi:hypothetical protein